MYEKFGFQCLRMDEMPPYFRRLARMAGFLGKLGIFPEEIYVMRFTHFPDSIG
jgi:hypothetical protein